MNRLSSLFAIIVVLRACSFGAEVLYPDFLLTQVNVGTQPLAVAVNPVTNRIYAVNGSNNSVSVIDGRTHAVVATVFVPTGSGAVPATALALNAITNKIYVAGPTTSIVAVIDGITNLVTTVGCVSNPYAIAVNPVTNKIYVAGNGITVINGATNDTTTVTDTHLPCAIAVNPLTNKVFFANQAGGTIPGYSGSLTVLDGATNAVVTIQAGDLPMSIALNPVTNLVFVCNSRSNDVSVFNGATNARISSIHVGKNPCAVAVNPVTNKVYVVNGSDSSVSVIDDSSYITYSAKTIPVGRIPHEVAVNPGTGKIYVTGDSTLTMIDGKTTATCRVKSGMLPCAIAINPVTNRIYTANKMGNTIGVIDGSPLPHSNGGYGQNVTGVVNPVTDKHYILACSNQSGLPDCQVRIYDYSYTPPSITLPIDLAGGYGFNPVVNPISNRIYFGYNFLNGSMTVIDGATNDPAAVTIGGWAIPFANIATNTVYAMPYSNSDSIMGVRNIYIMDNAVNVPIDTIRLRAVRPGIPFVNPVNGRLYVPMDSLGSILVIDGATRDTTRISINANPGYAAANQVTNRIYLTHLRDTRISLIDGATNAVSSFEAGFIATSILANPLTNSIYLGSSTGAGQLSVISGLTNTVIPIARFPVDYLRFNPVSNVIYTAKRWSDNSAVDTAMIIDGATNTLSPKSTCFTGAPIVNPVTNRFRLANGTVLDADPILDTKLWALPNVSTLCTTSVSRPVITGKAVNRLRPGHTGIWCVITGRSNFSSPLIAALTSGAGTDSVTWSWNWGADSLMPGENFLYAYALDSLGAGIGSTGNGAAVYGNLQVFPVYYCKSRPAAPSTIYPANGALGAPLPVEFRWHYENRVSGYYFQIAQDAGFSSMLHDTLLGSDTTFRVLDLSASTMYFWRLRATSPSGRGPWSTVQAFVTGVPTSIAIGTAAAWSFNAGNNGRMVFYTLPMQCRVRLSYFDLSGKLKAVAVNQQQGAGRYSAKIPFQSLANGIYVQVFHAGNFSRKNIVVVAK